MDRASVHVVIVNWNSGAQLRECLASFAVTANDDVTLSRVTVVDNASEDGSADRVDLLSAPLSIVRNPENRGFAAACNQGAEGSNADFILFLNPDTRLMPGSLEVPARYLRSPHHENVGIVGIQLVDGSGQVTRNTARVPTSWSMIGNSLALDRLMPSIFPPHFVTEWAHDVTREVGQVMGAFFFVRRGVFEALGGFDERFFVYYEDLDFAVRAREHGWSSVYLANGQAFHRGQGTTERATQQRTFYFNRSKILFALKYFHVLGASGVMIATLLLEPAMRVIASPRSAADTLRAFGMLWREVPAILYLARFRNRSS
jgi:N-acetylglucosaminyl-diphospho-decaprenol L-rhamnosyltransferase